MRYTLCSNGAEQAHYNFSLTPPFSALQAYGLAEVKDVFVGGRRVGCRVAIMIEVCKLAAQSDLGTEKHHEHYVLINDDTLADDHVRVLFGIASHGFLFKKMGI